LRSLEADSVPVLAVSSVSPPTGIDELVDVLDQRHRALDLPAHRLRGRRAAALVQFTVEHGERGVRALGGRRAAWAWLQAQPAGLDAPALVAGLESRAQGSRGADR
jgi:LAO/AO transport system kinase